MKLILTSAGITNNSIMASLIELLDKPVDEVSVVFVPTAANSERGDKQWLIEDLLNIRNVGFKSIDIIDISALSKNKWQKAFEETDLIIVSGGNTFYLMHWIDKSGLIGMLPELLKTKVYMGISAGSCMMGPKVLTPLQDFFPDEENEFDVENGLNFVPFHIVPHLNSDYFKDLKEDNIKKVADTVREPTIVLDDDSAIVISDEKTEIVGEGVAFKLYF